MRDAKPTIGLTLPASVRTQERARQVADAYRAALEAHGAEVVELVAGEASADLTGLHGLLLTGGIADIDPASYGEPRHPKTVEPEPARDELEFTLVQEATKRGMPVLGICRGAQVLGVAFGAKLVQHLPDVTALAHTAEGEQGARHRVRFAEGSRLREIVGQEELEVNSFHHQAVLGGGLRAVAWAEDGTVEAAEGASGFMIGVQWHPERDLGTEASARLFAAFVGAARTWGEVNR